MPDALSSVLDAPPTAATEPALAVDQGSRPHAAPPSPTPDRRRSGDEDEVGLWASIRTTLASPAGCGGLTVAVVLILAGLLSPWLAPYGPDQSDFLDVLKPPSRGHLLGTDELGRDIFSRVLYGINASVMIGLLSVFMATVTGIPIGLVAGFFRGADRVISLIVDVLLAFPNLILAVGLAAILGPSGLNAAIALAVGAFPGFVRITRGEVLRLRGLDFVASAIAAGATDRRLLFRHILPNASSALLVQITVSIPGAVLGEATLSFLGLGIRPPQPSLGTMLANAQAYIAQAWWMAVFPGLAVVALTLALNLFGDALRDAFDPKRRRR